MIPTHLRAVVAAFAVGLLGVVLLGPVHGQSPGTTPAPDPVGRPKVFQEGKGPAVAVWHDGNWCLALTTNKKNKGDVFTGSVRADKGPLLGVFDKLDKGKDGKGDWIFPHKDGGGFDFRFANFGGIDRTQFKASPGATNITFNVQVNGQPAPQFVLIGKAGKHPEKVPFSLPAFP
ncbi:MAG TPA: hypothetical protein VD866_10030 [Urbifossiella sp.]|nr:hypothetical protein [Urbifossiella sp.]